MKTDGGPTFPIERSMHCDTNSGMTLRDYFAGQAFGSVMCEPDIESYTQAARRAYEAADAMLAERERGENNG